MVFRIVSDRLLCDGTAVGVEGVVGQTWGWVGLWEHVPRGELKWIVGTRSKDGKSGQMI